MVKGLAALTNITVAATAALLLHGCGKPKEEEAEPTQADADAASGVHPSVEAQMDGRNKGKHTRERPDKDGNSQNIEDEFDGQTAITCTDGEKGDEECRKGGNPAAKCRSGQCTVPSVVGRKPPSASEIAQNMEKNDPNKRSDADREASELQGKTRKASLEADNPGKSKDYDKASQGMLGGITAVAPGSKKR